MTLLRPATLDELDALRVHMDTLPQLTIRGAGHSYLYYGVKQVHDLTEKSKEAINHIDSILKQIIGGYCYFCNFTEGGQLRIQYMWSPLFQGVGYLSLDELLYEEVQQ